MATPTASRDSGPSARNSQLELLDLHEALLRSIAHNRGGPAGQRRGLVTAAEQEFSLRKRHRETATERAPSYSAPRSNAKGSQRDEADASVRAQAPAWHFDGEFVLQHAAGGVRSPQALGPSSLLASAEVLLRSHHGSGFPGMRGGPGVDAALRPQQSESGTGGLEDIVWGRAQGAQGRGPTEMEEVAVPRGDAARAVPEPTGAHLSAGPKEEDLSAMWRRPSIRPRCAGQSPADAGLPCFPELWEPLQGTVQQQQDHLLHSLLDHTSAGIQRQSSAAPTALALQELLDEYLGCRSERSKAMPASAAVAAHEQSLAQESKRPRGTASAGVAGGGLSSPSCSLGSLRVGSGSGQMSSLRIPAPSSTSPHSSLGCFLETSTLPGFGQMVSERRPTGTEPLEGAAPGRACLSRSEPASLSAGTRISSEERRLRRRVSNRESARRVRKRHTDRLAELEAQLGELRRLTNETLKHLEEAKETISSLEQRNRDLKRASGALIGEEGTFRVPRKLERHGDEGPRLNTSGVAAHKDLPPGGQPGSIPGSEDATNGMKVLVDEEFDLATGHHFPLEYLLDSGDADHTDVFLESMAAETALC